MKFDDIAAAAVRLDDSLKRATQPGEPLEAQRPSPVLPVPIARQPVDPTAPQVGPDPIAALSAPDTDPAPKDDVKPAQAESLAAHAAASLAGEDHSLGEALRLALSEALGDPAAGSQLAIMEPELTPDQSARLAAFRGLVAELMTDETLSAEQLAAKLLEKARALEPARPLSIPTALLARRVMGYGKFTPFETSRFVAGREHAALVYVEVSNFSFTEAAPASTFTHIDAVTPAGETDYVIELTQELRLYHRADGVLAWMCREQTCRDASRRKRTDHYLVQRIVLPSSLTVGGYTLKVLLRDTGSGATAEAMIPIEIVADESLTRADRP